jgi:predicted component of type VI protein secretion system
MSRRSSLTVLAVLAASGALIAGCSSSSSSSSSTPTASATSAAASVSAPATSASSTAAGSSTKPSAADCVTINKISSGVITTLTPLQTEPQAKAAVAIKAYLAKLTTEEATLTSPAGKAALGSFITALGKSLTETTSQATTTVTTAIGNLSSACA